MIEASLDPNLLMFLYIFIKTGDFIYSQFLAWSSQLLLSFKSGCHFYVVRLSVDI